VLFFYSFSSLVAVEIEKRKVEREGVTEDIVGEEK